MHPETVRLYPRQAVIVFGHYLLSLLLVALTTGVLYVLRSSINPAIVALLYLLPVGLSTSLWGLGPGILAALAAFLAFNYFFIEPYYTLIVHQTQDILALIVFLGVAVLINQLLGRTRRSLEQATSREQEAIRLYELSTMLAGLNNEQALVQMLADRSVEAFQADRIVVFLENRPDRESVLVSVPELGGSSDRKPDLLIPLQTVRGLLGEIRLWRKASTITPTEDRLLRIFASQGALAIERAQLAQAETRARVLEESDRLKSSLLSSVSHELRTPLATIKAGVSSLRSGEMDWDSESRGELLAAIEEETDRLNQLVSNLLNMSRIEAGALKPERRWNVLAEIVQDVVNRISVRSEYHTIEIDVSEDLPLVPVDYIQMEQVFTNLISNSIKYSPSDTTIQISAWPTQNQEIQVRVKNQGPPVPEPDLERIFDKFHRITAADRITGSGLGLSICKGLVEAHGGRIWAENLSEGFAFNFSLPLTWEGASPRVELNE
jgi:two-component system sensor histidine kinase KdpD